MRPRQSYHSLVRFRQRFRPGEIILGSSSALCSRTAILTHAASRPTREAMANSSSASRRSEVTALANASDDEVFNCDTSRDAMIAQQLQEAWHKELLAEQAPLYGKRDERHHRHCAVQLQEPRTRKKDNRTKNKNRNQFAKNDAEQDRRGGAVSEPEQQVGSNSSVQRASDAKAAAPSKATATPATASSAAVSRRSRRAD